MTIFNSLKHCLFNFNLLNTFCTILGLLVVAKTKDTERHFRMAFAAQRIKKRYRAVAFGRIQEESGVIEEPISGKASETRYRVISRTRCNDSRANGWITTVDLYPVSGRKHQIRRHLKHIGHPIWGDRRYGWYTKKEAPEEDLSEDDKLDLLHATTVEDDAHARLCLWAMEICVPHPTTDAPVHIVLPKEPDWISQLLKIQEKIYFDSLLDEELKSASES
jgi:23S rRNA-/tRNA-specific pseudouridylate synthase